MSMRGVAKRGRSRSPSPEYASKRKVGRASGAKGRLVTARGNSSDDEESSGSSDDEDEPRGRPPERTAKRGRGSSVSSSGDRGIPERRKGAAKGKLQKIDSARPTTGASASSASGPGPRSRLVDYAPPPTTKAEFMEAAHELGAACGRRAGQGLQVLDRKPPRSATRATTPTRRSSTYRTCSSTT